MDRTAEPSVLHQRSTGEHSGNRAQTAHKELRTQRNPHPGTECGSNIYKRRKAIPPPVHCWFFHIYAAEFQNLRAGKTSCYRECLLEDHFQRSLSKSCCMLRRLRPIFFKNSLSDRRFPSSVTRWRMCLLYMDIPPFRGC